jgi:hypothetical protein
MAITGINLGNGFRYLMVHEKEHNFHLDGRDEQLQFFCQNPHSCLQSLHKPMTDFMISTTLISPAASAAMEIAAMIPASDMISLF